MGEPMTDETLCGICNKGYRSPFKWIVNGGNIYHDNCLFAEISRLTAERDRLVEALQEIADEEDTFNYGHKLPQIARDAIEQTAQTEK